VVLKNKILSQIMGSQFVAGPGALTTQAEGLASGLGSYEPFLQQAQQLRGPTAYQAYMSPYQQDIIDTTLAEFDVQAQKGLPGLAAQAIQAGAFGGGREGVQRAEYQAASDRNRAALQAQLLGQGFGQAQQFSWSRFFKKPSISTTITCLVRSTNWCINNIRWSTTSKTATTTISATTISTKTSFPTFGSC
jgi:hypothetical protein